MSDNNTNYALSFASLLTIALIVLKLCGVIKWSWIWVVCPIWITAIIMLGILIAYFVLMSKD